VANTGTKTGTKSAKPKKFIFPGGTNYLAAKNRWETMTAELNALKIAEKKRARNNGAGHSKTSKQSKRG